MFKPVKRPTKLLNFVEPYVSDFYKNSQGIILPFAGNGQFALKYLRKKNIKFIWINDTNIGITSIWKSVYKYPLKLIRKIDKYQPSLDHIDKFEVIINNANTPRSVEDITSFAIMQMAVYCHKYSPVGPIDELVFDKDFFRRKIIALNRQLKKVEVKITSWDFEQVINDQNCNGAVLLETPTNFSDNDHWRLSESIFDMDAWVLLSKDSPFVRRIYSGWATTIETGVENSELLTVTSRT